MGASQLRHENTGNETFHCMYVARDWMGKVKRAEVEGRSADAAAYREEAADAHPVARELSASTYRMAVLRAISIFFHRPASDEVRSSWVLAFFCSVAEEQKLHPEAMGYAQLGGVERTLLARIEKLHERGLN
jgi:hypothetical protein